jgi:hypothetical protein
VLNLLDTASINCNSDDYEKLIIMVKGNLVAT